MSGIQPVAVYAMRVPPGDIMVPAVPEFAAMFRLTMAAIDPSEELDPDVEGEISQPRATLKLVRVPEDMFGDDDSDSEDDEDYELDEEDDSEDEDEEEANGGPSDLKKSKKSKKVALLEALAQDEEDDDEDMDDDEDDVDEEEEAKAILKLQKLMKTSKGKAKAVDGEEASDGDDEDDDESDDAIDLDEVVLCTLDPSKQYQQALDFVVGEGEKVFFKVSGTHTVHLTGNYVIPEDDGQASLYDEEDEEEDYDLSPDEDELDALDALVDGGDESDELDDLEDPRLLEVDSEDDEAPKLIKDAGKGKNKRPAEDSDEDEPNLDDIMAKSLQKEETAPTTNGDTKKLSKAEKKKLKKLKKNDGEATPTSTTPEKKDTQTNGTAAEKKVQFAKNLEQGPTPSATPPTSKAAAADKSKPDTKKASLGVREVQGVTIDDRKVGSGPAAKKGSRLEMRYIGKLTDGKVFDSNKSGKPFSFKLGAGDVIKGWDIGMEGIQVGGERRITIPAKLAYGNKALPGIPANSKLVFDIKCLTIK